MILNCVINEIGVAGMWVSQYIKGINPQSGKDTTCDNGAIWNAARYLPDTNTFSTTCYSRGSVLVQPFLSKSLSYISHEGIKKYALLKDTGFIEDNFEMSAESHNKVNFVQYINESGIKCRASIIPCDNFTEVNSAPFAILVKHQDEIRVTDRLYMQADGKTQEIVFNFNKPDKIRVSGSERANVTYKAHDNTEWKLSISSDCFYISPKENAAYKSRINTIKFVGCALNKITAQDQKNIAMIIPVKN